MRSCSALASLCALLLSAPVAAATLTWPGPGPCATSLQACIDAAASGDTVQIARNAPIDEALLITRALQLRAAPGWSPVLSRSLEVQVPSLAPGARATITLERLRFEDAGIAVIHASSTPALLRLRGNIIRSVPAGASWLNGAALRVHAVTGSELELEIIDNHIDARLRGPGHAGHTAVSVGGDGSGMLTGLIARNRILMHGAPSAAAIDIVRAAGPTDLRIGLNRIEGSHYGHGIRMTAGDAGVSHIAGIYNNVVIGQDAGAGAGITLQPASSEMLVQVLSNTVTHGRRGLLVAAPAQVQVANNLFAYNGEDASIASGGVATFRNNLSHGNGSTRLAGSAGLVTGSPRLAYDGFRLRPGSAAIDAGEIDIGMSPMDFIDIDGMPRVKGAALDIGAHEAGARHVLHRATPSNTSGHVTTLDALAGLPGANPQLTQHWNPGGGGGVNNNQPVGLYYLGGRWRVFNQTLAPMPLSASFNVFVPGTAPAGHLSSASNSFDGVSRIHHAELDGRAEAFVLASHDWNGHGSPGRYMTTRWGLAYFDGHWNLLDLEAPFPYQRGFNLHVQARSPNAFVHITSASNVQTNSTLIDHPALNGRACALLQVTPRADGGALVTQPLGVWYTGSRWAVFQQGMATMPHGVMMHVLFDPAQVESCSRPGIFRDGMEAVPFRTAQG